MPYEVFIQSITSKSSRLLGQELVLDAKASGRNGLSNTQEIGMAMSGAKILYARCNSGVYAPPGFEEDTALRSAKPPRATMWLEHVYGYAGLKNLANNLFYTHRGEVRGRGGLLGFGGVCGRGGRWMAGGPSALKAKPSAKQSPPPWASHPGLRGTAPFFRKPGGPVAKLKTDLCPADRVLQRDDRNRLEQGIPRRREAKPAVLLRPQQRHHVHEHPPEPQVGLMLLLSSWCLVEGEGCKEA